MNPILPKTGCSPIGEPLFPSVVWGKACTAILESLRGLRKFLTVLSFDETLFISIACPLSSLPRDGGDVRGGAGDPGSTASLPKAYRTLLPAVSHAAVFVSPRRARAPGE